LRKDVVRVAIVLSLVVLVGLSHSAVTASAGEKELSKNDKVIKVGSTPPTDAPVKEIEVSTKKYEYNPTSIEVPVNTLVKIHLKALDREHGFEIKSIKDSCVKFKPNESATVEFYADKTGEFEFACCNFCGFGHGKMKGKLIVK
jgi:heme/copper-type cytochrome/quinol oxidase subunit 2